jgi:hypothetical protein
MNMPIIYEWGLKSSSRNNKKLGGKFQAGSFVPNKIRVLN